MADFMEHFTSYIGHMSLSRVLGLYELYKRTLGVSGHIGEIGTYKGASFFLFAKLVVLEAKTANRLYQKEYDGYFHFIFCEINFKIKSSC